MAKRIKRPRGRPSLPEHQRKGRILKFRARGDLVSRMQAAAQATGRSVSEEIEYRLERSFDHERSAALDRELIQETVSATLLELARERYAAAAERWAGERRLSEADIVNLMPKLREQLLREQAEEQTSAATNEDKKSQEAAVVNLMEWLREQLLRGQVKRQSSAGTHDETKNRTSTGDNKP